jgi:flavorubredoxin/flavin reductase (DIM6/NTAB) family NADH-FMN oxidoreductase RutF
MYQIKQIREDVFWVGGNDRRLALFENVYPIPNGVSYNSYLVLDEKTVLIDTVDKAVSDVFFENLEHLLKGRTLDFVIVNHMEPDHCAMLPELLLRYPKTKIVGNEKTFTMIGQYFESLAKADSLVVKEGDTLTTGKHTFTFVMAPMVHWPEVMVTYDTTDKTLYSADAFGTFGALNGNIFADELPFERDWLPDARRYYTNIVGKYGLQVQSLLQKASGIEISMICPLHGPVWRKDINWFIEKYYRWSSYTPEDHAVMIAYASIYGNTKNAAEILAGLLGDLGVKNIVMYDVSVTHHSVIVAEAFRCSHLVFASTTYNAGIFCNMEAALLDIKAHWLQHRTVALIENGTWAATSGSLMAELFSSMENMTLLGKPVSLRSSVKQEQLEGLKALARAIFESMPRPADLANLEHVELKIEPAAMFKLSYGLFVLSARDGDKDNGCIVNAVTQVTDSPKRIAVCVNKQNYTHDMILKTGKLNVSILSTDVSFKAFQHFGFQSGRTVNKFADWPASRSDNGLLYLTESANAFMSGRVFQMHDYGTHTEFVADLTQAVVLSEEVSVTYQYYFDRIKPKPQLTGEKKKGFICKICGYFHEGDSLPPDIVCPLCKHGAEDFERLE